MSSPAQPAEPQDNRDDVDAPNRGGGRADKSQDSNSAAAGRLTSQIDPAAMKTAQAQSRRLARSHYENFLVATVLLPKRLRQPFYNVYAYCRTADDLADESPSPEEALRRLDGFQRQLDETYEGRPRDSLFIALAHTIEQFDLPKQPFDDLLSAFRQDQHQNRYRDFDELVDYCRRSANPVGRIVLRLGDSFDEPRAEWADQICTGLQLANFWQDVARDFAIGRIYLPQDEMVRFGVTESMLADEQTAEPLKDLLKSECDRAELFFSRGMPLVEAVPKWFASDIRLFAAGGLATLEAIRRIDYDVLARRPTVGKGRQLWMVAKATLDRLRGFGRHRG